MWTSQFVLGLKILLVVLALLGARSFDSGRVVCFWGGWHFLEGT